MTPTGSEVAIIGGGIGGMATAAFLARAGINSTVYEQASQVREIGAGLVVAPNAARLLRRLGVIDRLLVDGVRLESGWEFRRWNDGTVLSSEQLNPACKELYGEHTYTVHRADLLDAVAAAVPAGTMRLGMRAEQVTIDHGMPVVTFANGEVIRPDVLIGADGIHSVVRPSVAEPGPASYSGMAAYRTLVPAESAPEFARRPAQTLWIGPGRHLVHYPVSGGRLINVVAFAPSNVAIESWTATTTVEEFLEEFEGWDPRLTDLIRAAREPGRWALLDRAPLTRWSAERVTLLGDAAHPMFPFFAQGAAQSMEDAAALALCLKDDMDAPERALHRYESHRIERTTRLQQISHARAEINHLPDGPEQAARDQRFVQEDPLLANGWIYGYDPEREILADRAEWETA